MLINPGIKQKINSRAQVFLFQKRCEIRGLESCYHARESFARLLCDVYKRGWERKACLSMHYSFIDIIMMAIMYIKRRPWQWFESLKWADEEI